jgi:arabinofuranan 3-O-arabinosyltransferase
MVRVPDDLTTMARDPAVLAMMASSDLAFVFERARSGSQFLPDEEQGILRRFDVPVSRTFSLSGLARLDRGAPDEEIDRLVRVAGPVSASSSSRFLDDPALRASAALDGNPDTAWVPAGTVGQWIRVTFPRRRLDRFGMEAQSMPGRTPISQIRVAFPDGSSFTRPVPPNGRLEVRFAARATSSVTIAVTGVAYAGQGPPPPVGIAEVRIPGVSIPAAPRRAAAPCMAGPAFTIDGRPVPIRFQGTIGALLDGRQLKLSACRDALALGPGRHDFVAAGALQPDTLVLASRGTAPRPATSGPPATSVHARPDGGYDIDVAGAAAPFYLVTGQDWDPGWTATIQGTSLGRPMILDGYAAGWRVDRAGSYLILIRYKPQRRFEAALALSAAAFLIAIAIVGWSRRPRRKA